MRKSFLIIISLAVILISSIYFIINRTVCFVYVNPYTQTSGFPYIAKTLKNIDVILNQTKSSLAFDGYKIKYIYQNPYGSGFLKNNPIPNDLDYSVGIDLGTFNYDGKNGVEIATKLVDTINLYYFYFISNIYSEPKLRLYPLYNSFNILDATKKTRAQNISDIADNLDNVIKQKPYVKYTTLEKIEDIAQDVIIPYIINSNEIILQDSKQIKLYTESISYNESMPHYLREFSVIPEFYVKLKYNKKIYDVELVPEIFPGTRLQLSRRCFGSTVFNRLYSYKFLKNVSWLNDDKTYIDTRLLSYKRHIGEIENLQALSKSPVKILKRIMQSAEMVKPLLSQEEYNMITDFVKTNMGNKDIQLLNEVSNIYSNIYDIALYASSFGNFTKNGNLAKMCEIADNIKNELKQRGSVDEKTISIIDQTNKYIIENILSKNIIKSETELLKEFENVKNNTDNAIVTQMNALMYKPEQIKSIIEIYRKIYTDAGFHCVKFVWLGKDKIGIVKDDFTKNIKDINLFVKENNLVENITYSIIDKNEIKKDEYNMSFVSWVKYNQTTKEKEIYEKLVNTLIKDRKNFSPKFKFVFI